MLQYVLQNWSWLVSQVCDIKADINLQNKYHKHTPMFCCGADNLIVWFKMNIKYLFGVLRRFQHCTGHITTGSWKGRGNQYI